MWWKWWLMIFKNSSWKTVASSLCSLFLSLSLSLPLVTDMPCQRMLQWLYGDSLMKGNSESQTQLKNGDLLSIDSTWVRHLEAGPLSPVKLSDGAALMGTLTATSWETLAQSQLICPQTCNLETVGDSKYLLFQASKFWGNFYTSIGP